MKGVFADIFKKPAAFQGATKEFMSKNVPLLILVIVLVMVYISNKYACSLSLIEIDRLKVELNRAESEYIIVYGELKSVSRQPQVESRLIEQQLDLTRSEIPLLKLEKR